MAQSGDKLTLNSSGDHHHASVTVNPKTGRVSRGAVCNFSDNAMAALNVDSKGKVSGFAAHTGDTHNFRIDANPDGGFNAGLTLEPQGLNIAITGGTASLAKGTIRPAGLNITADHHSASLHVDPAGRLTGTIATHNTPLGDFNMTLKHGAVVSGAFVHKAMNHTTSIGFYQGKWTANVEAGKGNGKLSLAVTAGKAVLRARAGKEMGF